MDKKALEITSDEADIIFDALDDTADGAIDSKRYVNEDDEDELKALDDFIDEVRDLQFRIRELFGHDTTTLYGPDWYNKKDESTTEQVVEQVDEVITEITTSTDVLGVTVVFRPADYNFTVTKTAGKFYWQAAGGPRHGPFATAEDAITDWNDH